MEEDETIKILKELFEAVPKEFFFDNEQLEFMEKRHEIENNLSYSIEAYTDNYDLINEYGLDLKLIQKLEWFIVFYLENHNKAFIETEFYKKFRDHQVVQRAFSEYERRMELKK